MPEARKHSSHAEKGASPYLVGAGIIIIAIAVIAAVWYGGSLGQQTNSTTTVQGNPSSNCPCLSEQQFQAIMATPAALKASALYNTTYTSNALQWLSASFIVGNVSNGWAVQYQTQNVSEAAQEVIVQSDNAPGLYNLSVELAQNYYNKTFTFGGAVDGLTYSYLSLPASANADNMDLYVLYGYKGGYAVSLSFITNSSGVMPFNQVAAYLAPTV